MISNKDRSGYFGASDTKYIVGNWSTKTFQKWWLQKLGILTTNFSNEYTMAGTNFEHKILDSLEIDGLEKDKQIIIEKYKLRVNLDGNTDRRIHEVKTYKYEKGFDLTKHKDYINQVQVQMYADKKREAEIDAYGLLEEDYKNYCRTIDKKRLEIFEIQYDDEFIEKVYLPRLKYLSECLIKGQMPKIEEYEKGEL